MPDEQEDAGSIEANKAVRGQLLEAELKGLDQRREEIQSQLGKSGLILKRSIWDNMTPQQQADHFKRGGTLIDD